jgi:hypothetical protein
MRGRMGICNAMEDQDRKQLRMFRFAGAIILAAIGLGLLTGDGGPTKAGFAALCAIIGACFGGAIGLIVCRPILLTLIGAVLCLLFALQATLG